MKRKATLLLVVLLLLSLAVDAAAVTAPAEGWRETLEEAVRNWEETVEFASGGVKVSELMEVLDGFYRQPDLFYYGYGSYMYYESDPETAISVTFHYLPYTQAEIREYEEAALAALAEALLPGMSDLQKALALHDWLAVNVSYDQATFEGTSVNEDAYTAFGALVERTAVCQGYSMAYIALLERCGIEAAYASSDAMNHGWTLVKLDGNWYHVDVTWDDPTPDRLGQAEHTFFLLSDQAIRSRDSGSGDLHYDWVSDASAGDTRYDEGEFWTSLEQPLVFTDSSTVWHLSSEGQGSEQTVSLLRRDWTSGAETEAVTVYDYWPVYGKEGYYWTNVYSGLCLWDERIWFNGPDCLYSYDPSTGDNETISLAVGDSFLYGIAAAEDGILCLVSTGPKEEGEIMIYRAERKYASQPETPVPQPETPTADNPFTDVSYSDYYYDAVLWAYENGITTGKTEDSFAPGDTCTRAQAVTFFWRAAGRPAPATAENPFCDVPEGSYYRDAVLWASENGILQGTGTDPETGLARFSPNDDCSYAHILTILWRAMTGNRNSASGSWYSDALAWAEAGGLLAGTGFDPAGAPNAQLCPRMDIVEYLYRYAKD